MADTTEITTSERTSEKLETSLATTMQTTYTASVSGSTEVLTSGRTAWTTEVSTFTTGMLTGTSTPIESTTSETSFSAATQTTHTTPISGSTEKLTSETMAWTTDGSTITNARQTDTSTLGAEMINTISSTSPYTMDSTTDGRLSTSAQQTSAIPVTSSSQGSTITETVSFTAMTESQTTSANIGSSFTEASTNGGPTVTSTSAGKTMSVVILSTSPDTTASTTYGPVSTIYQQTSTTSETSYSQGSTIIENLSSTATTEVPTTTTEASTIPSLTTYLSSLGTTDVTSESEPTDLPITGLPVVSSSLATSPFTESTFFSTEITPAGETTTAAILSTSPDTTTNISDGPMSTSAQQTSATSETISSHGTTITENLSSTPTTEAPKTTEASTIVSLGTIDVTESEPTGLPVTSLPVVSSSLATSSFTELSFFSTAISPVSTDASIHTAMQSTEKPTSGEIVTSPILHTSPKYFATSTDKLPSPTAQEITESPVTVTLDTGPTSKSSIVTTDTSTSGKPITTSILQTSTHSSANTADSFISTTSEKTTATKVTITLELTPTSEPFSSTTEKQTSIITQVSSTSGLQSSTSGLFQSTSGFPATSNVPIPTSTPSVCENGGVFVPGSGCNCTKNWEGQRCEIPKTTISVDFIDVTTDVVVRTDTVFIEEFRNTSSPKYKEFVKNFTMDMESVYRATVKHFKNITVLRLRPGSVVVEHKIFVAIRNDKNLTMMVTESHNEIKEALDKLKNCTTGADGCPQLPIIGDPEYSQPEIDLSSVCTGEVNDFSIYYTPIVQGGEILCMSACDANHPRPKSCNTGRCQIEQSGPVCICDDAYWYSKSDCSGRIRKRDVYAGVGTAVVCVVCLIVLLGLYVIWQSRKARRMKDSKSEQLNQWLDEEFEWPSREGWYASSIHLTGDGNSSEGGGLFGLDLNGGTAASTSNSDLMSPYYGPQTRQVQTRPDTIYYDYRSHDEMNGSMTRGGQTLLDQQLLNIPYTDRHFKARQPQLGDYTEI
ncbi:serine-rich adhesin for platelets-like isoform X1 [Myxocyprinus asiaticus]|uniref:serine-rich adhesin for platelets-like isoform X1 n=1 Tax=Myxocyprinus asiaticus TaxID=70543 RepID=UPI00222296C0|nr:serine-rich adhesin for platelets-like isoform X1 [Myxocyprinus asiaticus]